MKYKARLKRLEARIRNWETCPKNPAGSYTKPGSLNK